MLWDSILLFSFIDVKTLSILSDDLTGITEQLEKFAQAKDN